jgi:hypothetical protein
MEKTAIQSTPLGKQSMLDKLYKNDSLCIAISKKVNADVGNDFTGYTRRGKAKFINCVRIEVSRGTKAHFQRFDFLFSITCHYERKEMLDAQPDNFNYYHFHEIKVVVRENIDKPVEDVVKAMQDVFKSNVLLLKSYAGNAEELKIQLAVKQIHLIFESDL